MDFDTRVKLVVYNRPLVRIDQRWVLATTWYSTRPKPDEMRPIFAGLERDFRDPTSDHRFGSLNSPSTLADPDTGNTIVAKAYPNGA